MKRSPIALMLAAGLALAAGRATADGGPGAASRCGQPTACVTTLPPEAAAGSPCEGQTVQLFERTSAGPAALQCADSNAPDERLVLLFDPRQPAGPWLLHEGGRVVLDLAGLAEAGVPDRFARHPLCPEARQAAASRPDLLPGRLVLLRKRPAEPYCFELRVASLVRGAPVLRLPDGSSEAPLAHEARPAWRGLVAVAMASGSDHSRPKAAR